MKYSILALLLTASFTIQAQTNLRDVGSFSDLKVSGNLEVLLIHSDEEGVKVIRDHDHLKIDRNGNVLRISVDKVGQLFKDRDPSAKVHIHYTNINELVANAGVNVNHEGVINFRNMEMKFGSGANGHFEVEGNQLLARAGEGAILKLSGKVESLEAKSNTGGHLQAGSLMADHVEAEASTGGMASVHANKSISADAHTGGAITYQGNPEKYNIKESLGGSVKGN